MILYRKVSEDELELLKQGKDYEERKDLRREDELFSQYTDPKKSYVHFFPYAESALLFESGFNDQNKKYYIVKYEIPVDGYKMGKSTYPIKNPYATDEECLKVQQSIDKSLGDELDYDAVYEKIGRGSQDPYESYRSIGTLISFLQEMAIECKDVKAAYAEGYIPANTKRPDGTKLSFQEIIDTPLPEGWSKKEEFLETLKQQHELYNPETVRYDLEKDEDYIYYLNNPREVTEQEIEEYKAYERFEKIQNLSDNIIQRLQGENAVDIEYNDYDYEYILDGIKLDRYKVINYVLENMSEEMDLDEAKVESLIKQAFEELKKTKDLDEDIVI